MNVVNIATILALLSLTQCSSEALNYQDPPKASEQRCEVTSDCSDPDRICHENRCICSKEKPIEDESGEGLCLPQVLIGERCLIQTQCLVDSSCIDGYCKCADEAVPIYNPSSKIYYCQPRRGLEEECNADLQCPTNAYCSVRGCLCSNGFGPQNVSLSGTETTQCLPKTCSPEGECPDYHQCDDKICKCLPTHFDISRARCYSYNIVGISPEDLANNNLADQDSSSKTNHHHHHSTGGDFISTLKDLTSVPGDKQWLVLIILITLSLLTLIIILSVLRKHYLGYCWTAHKKEYEPNTAKQQVPKNSSHFDKSSINNKSFRRRNGDALDEEEDSSSTEDRSNLVAKRRDPGDFIAVDLNGEAIDESTLAQTSEQRKLKGPLKSSTSTPV